MAQLTTIINKLDNFIVNSISTTPVCGMCARNHHLAKCPQGNPYASSSMEQAQVVGSLN